MTEPRGSDSGRAAGAAEGSSAPRDSALAHARAAVALLFGAVPGRRFSVRYWTGDEDAPPAPGPYTLVVRRAGALRRMLLPPSELSLVEAFLSGDVEVEGDLEQAMRLGDTINARVRSPRTLAALVRHLRALPRDSATSDVRQRRAERTVQKVGGRHEPSRDRAAIRYHYDVGNDFYALWLDRRMVYSCAYFDAPLDPARPEQLDEAQLAKLDLVCRKLRLRPGETLLDVGCGWGALILHAAAHYGVTALGITLSEAQAELARSRIQEAGLAERCTVRILDYRSIPADRTFDKIASVGMVEHVGVERLRTYFDALYAALRPGGALLNHGIVSIERPVGRWDWLERRLWKRDAFIDQYVFPDGRLGPLHAIIHAAELAGFETRDVESLREHYVFTLREWVRRLETRREQAIALTDERTYRTWRLYMAASAHGFVTGRIGVVQTLLVKATASGASGLPLRREYMLG